MGEDRVVDRGWEAKKKGGDFIKTSNSMVEVVRWKKMTLSETISFTLCTLALRSGD